MDVKAEDSEPAANKTNMKILLIVVLSVAAVIIMVSIPFVAHYLWNLRLRLQSEQTQKNQKALQDQPKQIVEQPARKSTRTER